MKKKYMKKILLAAAMILTVQWGVSGKMLVQATQTETGSSTGSVKSADNSLSKLSLSVGNLSPEFYYSTTTYTASVPYETTAVEVHAETSHKKAVVESITGNTDLQPGENTIKVTVRAENDAKAVYVIHITRESASSGGASDGTEGEAAGGTEGEATGGAEGEAAGGAEGTPAVDDVNSRLEAYQQQIEECENRISVIQNEYQKLEEKYKSEKTSGKTVIAVLVFFLLVALIVLVNLLVLLKKRGSQDAWLDEDWEEPERFRKKNNFEKKRASKKEDTVERKDTFEEDDFFGDKVFLEEDELFTGKGSGLKTEPEQETFFMEEAEEESTSSIEEELDIIDLDKL